MAVKILGICGSYRKASTYAALEAAMDEAAKVEGVETQIIELRGRKMSACMGCNRCIKENVNQCLSYPDDDMQEVFDAIGQADGFIIASPIYAMSITPSLSMVFSRLRPNFVLTRVNPDINLYKVGGAIAVGGTRNGGQEMTINAIHGLYHTKGITVVNGGLGVYGGGSVWSGDGGAQGAKDDEVGMKHVRAMGRRVAKAAVAMKRGSEQV